MVRRDVGIWGEGLGRKVLRTYLVQDKTSHRYDDIKAFFAVPESMCVLFITKGYGKCFLERNTILEVLFKALYFRVNN